MKTRVHQITRTYKISAFRTIQSLLLLMVMMTTHSSVYFMGERVQWKSAPNQPLNKLWPFIVESIIFNNSICRSLCVTCTLHTRTLSICNFYLPVVLAILNTNVLRRLCKLFHLNDTRRLSSCSRTSRQLRA